MEREKIAVAMSGGVDSSVAAFLLKEEGYDPIGITLKLFDPRKLTPHQAQCSRAAQDLQDAKTVAEHLHIPHQTMVLQDAFAQQVIAPFIQAYEEGKTPNPCVICNRTIKFGVLLDQISQYHCNLLATGHYARVEQDKGSGRFLVKRACYPEKDQSYVLWSLSQSQLSRIRFPLGERSKEEIRALAAQQGLISAEKEDSQDICFVPDGDYVSFIRHYTGREYPTGDLCDTQGNVLGQHRGIIEYTIGQRRGLGVSSAQGRQYVKEIRPQAQQVILSSHQELFHRSLVAKECNLLFADHLSQPIQVWAKVRYRMTPQKAWIEQTEEDTLRVTFDQPQRAITPGQSVVFYDGEVLLGGGVIDEIGD